MSGRVATLLACCTLSLAAQEWPFPWPQARIAHYTARRASSPIVIDGRLDEADWRAAERSPRFSDLVDGRPGIHDTRAAVLWNDDDLYVGYWVEEPFVEATLTERDAPIYKNNDVELFIAGRDAYCEFEINSFGTIYEVFFIWEHAFESAGYARRPEFQRTREGVRPFNGVGFKRHPRGPRIGYWSWDMPGLASAVHVDGTINDNRDRDRGWTVELRIPWRSLEPLAMPDRRALPPRDGDVWRMDFSRFNQYKEAPPAKDPGGWAWSPHGVWDSHIPELFTHVRFSTEPVGREPRAQDPATRPRAFIDGNGPGWRTLGPDDFAGVNGDPDTWKWEADLLRSTGVPIGVMRTRDIFTNFELVIEWRHLKAAGNSGVFAWVPMKALDGLPPGQLPRWGIEVQMLDHGYRDYYAQRSGGKPGTFFTTNGDIFAVGNSKLEPFEPRSPDGSRSFPRSERSRGAGDWNHYYVRAINGEIRLWVNGEEVSGGRGADPKTGFLCLEAEGAPIEFRNIRVRELP